jgi:cytochrome c
MSTMVVNKAFGAILLVALALVVIGMVGNALVDPGARKPAAVKVAATGAGAAKKPAVKAAALEPVAPMMAQASAARGAKVFKKCAACHDVTNGGKHKIGPNLWNTVAGARGAKAGFSYSKAMKGKQGRWTYESLNAFFAKPKVFMPGTKMAFGGLKKVKDRADLIAYLRGLSGSPAPLP